MFTEQKLDVFTFYLLGNKTYFTEMSCFSEVLKEHSHNSQDVLVFLALLQNFGTQYKQDVLK